MAITQEKRRKLDDLLKQHNLEIEDLREVLGQHIDQHETSISADSYTARLERMTDPLERYEFRIKQYRFAPVLSSEKEIEHYRRPSQVTKDLFKSNILFWEEIDASPNREIILRQAQALISPSSAAGNEVTLTAVLMALYRAAPHQSNERKRFEKEMQDRIAEFGSGSGATSKWLVTCWKGEDKEQNLVGTVGFLSGIEVFLMKGLDITAEVAFKREVGKAAIARYYDCLHRKREYGALL